MAFFLLLLSSAVQAMETANITLQVPKGTTNHGDLNLLCTPAQWTDVILFLCSGFLAHALTVVSKPGEPCRDLLPRTIMSLFFPNYGLRDGLDAIFRHAILIKDPLQRAARTGALCVLMRSQLWRPRIGDVIPGIKISEKELRSIEGWAKTVDEKCHEADDAVKQERSRKESDSKSEASSVTLHAGACDEDIADAIIFSDRPKKSSEASDITLGPSTRESATETLPELIRTGFYAETLCDGKSLVKAPSKFEINGPIEISNEYEVMILPEEADVEPIASIEAPIRPDEIRYRATLSAHYTLAKAVVAIFQTLFSCFTLYKSRGDQIDRYGYSAFGLTVAPYSVMSIINLIGNLCTPDFAALQLVGSPALDEALGRRHKIVASVGQLKETCVETNSWTGIIDSIDDDNQSYTMILSRSGPLHAKCSQFKGRNPLRIRLIISSPSQHSPLATSRLPKPPPKPKRFPLSATHFPKLTRRSPLARRSVRAFLILLITLTPFAINFSISHFSAGSSSFAQRFWTMSWLVVGAVGRVGTIYGPVKEYLAGDEDKEDWFWTGSTIVLCLCVYGMPAMGGMATVVGMLVEYGACERFA